MDTADQARTTEDLLSELVGHVRTIKRILIVLFVVLVVLPLGLALISWPAGETTTTETIENSPVSVR